MAVNRQFWWLIDYLQSYQLAEDLGKAFSERIVLESTLAAEQQAAGSMQRVLGLLRTLYVLSAADEGAVFLRYVHSN